MSAARKSRNEGLPLAAFSTAELLAWEKLDTSAAGRLEARLKEHKIPSIEYQPSDDEVVVYRLPAQEQKTEGGLVLPEFGIDSDPTDGGRRIAQDRIVNVGLLINAGLSARDWLRSHGLLFGDRVKFGKYAGEEESLRWFLGGASSVAMTDVLAINVMDLRGSFDLWDRLYGPKPSMRMVFVSDGAGTGLHVIKPIVKEK